MEDSLGLNKRTLELLSKDRGEGAGGVRANRRLLAALGGDIFNSINYIPDLSILEYNRHLKLWLEYTRLEGWVREELWLQRVTIPAHPDGPDAAQRPFVKTGGFKTRATK